MKIESRIKRRNGHSVEIDGATYEFRPPAYVAEVANQAHINRLLAITEGYVAAEKAPEAPGKKAGTEQDESPREEVGDAGREALADAYELKFGRRPHGKWTAEKIGAALHTEDGSAE